MLMPDEHVYAVDGSTAIALEPISLSEAGLTERQHLQEWVLAHPEMLGDDVMIVTFEFDRWWSSGGAPERDRLDVLGLDRSGRLVVAELKRDRAPDTVEMQAIKYAAMASRFTPEILATQHARFRTIRGEPTGTDAALEALQAHSAYRVAENLAKPRIVLLASSFPPVVTATTVWLTEMSLDITLMSFQAYRAADRTILTVSQLYPVPDVKTFTVAPARSANAASEEAEVLPEVPWTIDDLTRLSNSTNATTQALLEWAIEAPGQWIGLRELEARAGRSPAEARADLAQLTRTIKRTLSRSNWPFELQRPKDGVGPWSYRLPLDLATAWRAVSGASAGSGHEGEDSTSTS